MRNRKNSKEEYYYEPPLLYSHSFRRLFGYCAVTSVLFLLGLSWTYSELFFPRREYIGNLVVGVIASKEVTYIEEWLTHHFYYGVDKIVIFDNNKPEDVEEKTEMRRICASFGGRCEIIDFNMYDDTACILTNSYLCHPWLMPKAEGTSHSVFAPTRRQGMAMKEFYYFQDNYKKYRWVMMFDVDEFMVTKDVNTKIPEVLQQLPREVHAVHVPRYTFGTDNHTTRPTDHGGSVRLNYCWREDGVNNAKGMARSSEVWLPGLSNHFYTTRSMASYSGLTGLPKYLKVEDYVGGRGEKGGEIRPSEAALLELPEGVRGVTKYNHFYVDHNVLVLNHYLTKSKEEHLARRSRASLNYMYKLKDVYKDDKTAVSRYTRPVCEQQKLSLLPPLLTAQDLRSAEDSSNRHLQEQKQNATTALTAATATLTTASTTRNSVHQGYLRKH